MAMLPAVLTMLLGGLTATYTPNAAREMSCTFRSETEPAMRIRVQPKGATDAPGIHVVSLRMRDETLRGLVAPLGQTDARDVVMKGVTADRTTYFLALRDSGKAVLRWRRAEDGAEVKTRTGQCRDFRGALESWLNS